MNAITVIKGMKNFVSLFEFCESRNLIKKDAEFFDCEFYDEEHFDSLFAHLWIRKLRFILSSYSNISILDDNMFNLKIEYEKEVYDFTFIYSFDSEELGSVFFAETDELRILCFNSSIKERFASLMLNEFPYDAEISEGSIIIKINRENCFEKIVEVIEKLKTIIV